MNESQAILPAHKSRFEGLVPHFSAFAIVLIAAICYSHFVQIRNIIPTDALIIQTYGHNREALRALQDSHIPTIKILERSAIPQTSFFASVTWATPYLAAVFLGYFCALALIRRLLR